MIFTTKADGLSISVKSHGAELCSLIGTDNVEYMWQADPVYWPRHAPILFPIVGRLKDDRYLHEGTLYPMKQHGFARDSDFSLVRSAPGELCFRLQPSESTRTQYPFKFQLDVTYRIRSSALSISYDVQNQGSVVMPFSVGAHPAFSCTWQPNDSIENYYLEFEQAETVDTCLLRSGLLTSNRERILDGEKTLPLTPHTFDKDAIILFDHRSRQLSLCRHDSTRRLTVEFPEFPFLGIWAKAGAPFVCIEPWMGHADPIDEDGELMAKAGIIRLAPGADFSCTHRVILSS